MKTLVALVLALAVANGAMVYKSRKDAGMSRDIRTASGISASGLTKRDTCSAPTALTAAEQTESVTSHNNLRRDENAANILELTWNEDLAKRAQEWANACHWAHGMTTSCDGSENIGQNMYMAGGGSDYPTLTMHSMIQAWFDEKVDYHFDTKGCNAGKMCGHYTQVVWAESSEVGCGVAKCPTVTVPGGDPWENVVMYVCDYSPSGNWIGEPIYEKGSPCSACADSISQGGFKCEDGLCKPCLPSQDADCKCDSHDCSNGGQFIPGDCSCKCPDGFFGKSCENVCANQSDDVCEGWKPFCVNAAYENFMRSHCPKACSFC